MNRDDELAMLDVEPTVFEEDVSASWAHASSTVTAACCPGCFVDISRNDTSGVFAPHGAICANNPVNSRDPFGLCAEGGDGWYGWWDRLEAWSRNNVNESFNATSGLWWPLQGTLLTAMELGHGLAAFPSAIGHLGEGSGTFAGDPSWETSPGLFMDISTVASVGAITAIGLPSARTPFGRTPAGRAYTQHYGTETGPVRNIPGSVIDNTINVGQSSRVAGGKTVYYEPANDVTVVVGRRGIMSARRGAP